MILENIFIYKFEQPQKMKTIFKFMFDSESFKRLEYQKQKKYYQNLLTTFTHYISSDFEIDDLTNNCCHYRIIYLNIPIRFWDS